MMRDNSWTAYVGALSVAGLLGWGGRPGLDAAEPPPLAPPAQFQGAEQNGPSARPEADVAATVNGIPISNAEVQARLQTQLQGQNMTAETVEQVREQVLESLIDMRLVEQYAIENVPDIDAKSVDGVLSHVHQQLESQGTNMSRYLQSRGQDERSLRRQIRASMAWQQVVAEQTSAEKLQGYFEDHKEQFDGSQVRARHILVELPLSADEAQQQAALEKLRQIQTALQGGADFATVAQQASDDAATAAQGGDVGYFPRKGRMIEPFAEAAFSLEVGEVSEPVRTQFGLHLIQVVDRQSGNRSFTEARSDVATVCAAELWSRIAQQMRAEAEIRRARPVQGAAADQYQAPVR